MWFGSQDLIFVFHRINGSIDFFRVWPLVWTELMRVSAYKSEAIVLNQKNFEADWLPTPLKWRSLSWCSCVSCCSAAVSAGLTQSQTDIILFTEWITDKVTFPSPMNECEVNVKLNLLPDFPHSAVNGHPTFFVNYISHDSRLLSPSLCRELPGNPPLSGNHHFLFTQQFQLFFQSPAFLSDPKAELKKKLSFFLYILIFSNKTCLTFPGLWSVFWVWFIHYSLKFLGI